MDDRPTPAPPADAAPPRRPWSAWLSTLTVLIVTAVIVAWALPSSIQGGDAGEFATVMLRGGVPHPSGYPWMRMLSPLARAGEVIGLSPAAAAALPCAIAGALAWVWLHRLVSRWGNPWLAFVAVTLVATASPVVLHVNDSEVWGPLLLFATAILAACLRPRPLAAVIGGLLLGLAVSHHLTAVLLLPMVVGACWPDQVSLRALLGKVLEGTVGFAVGLLPYLTLWTNDGAWRWGDTGQLVGLVRHVTRADYGVFSLSLHEGHPPMLDLLARSVTTVGRALTAGLLEGPVAAALVFAVVFVLAWRQARHHLRRPLWWGLVASLVASQVAFPLAHNIDPRSPFGAWILERFDLLTLWLWTPLLALAFVEVWVIASSRWIRVIVGLALFGLLPVQISNTWLYGIPRGEDSLQRYAYDVVSTPPAETTALVIGTDDHRLFPLLFVDRVLNGTGKTVYVDASLLSQPWYRREVRRRWSELPEVEKPFQLIHALWSDPARKDMPIYFANLFSPKTAALRRVPEGVLWRLVPPDAAGSAFFSFENVLHRHRQALDGYVGVRPSSQPAHPWSREVATHYVDGTRMLEAMLRDDQRASEADALHGKLNRLLGPTAPDDDILALVPSADAPP